MDQLDSYPPFATAADFATILKTNLSAEDTATVETLLAASSKKIRQACGWQVWPSVEDTLTRDGNGSGELLLPVNYVTAVDAVSDDGVELTAGDDYDWSEYGILTRTGRSVWTRKRRGVVIGLTHGYADSPQDLMVLSVAVASRQFDSPRGRIREQAGQVSVTYSQTSPSVSGGVVLLKVDIEQLSGYRAARR